MDSNSDHAHVRFPPPLFFLSYLIVALLLQWAVPLPSSWPAALRVLGGVVVVIGLILGASAFREMRRMHTSPAPHLPVTALVTSGPYRFTRNPIYMGFLLIYLGFTLLAGTLWGLLLSPLLIVTVIRLVVHAEEAYLDRRFTEQYRAYKSRVRQWL